MFFALSKIVFFFAQPSSLIVFLLVAGLLLGVVGLRRLGRGLVAVSLALLLLLTVTPLGVWLLVDLENRFPLPPPDAPKPSGIVLLGGFTDGRMNAARGVIGVNDGVSAVFEVAEMAKRWPDVPILLSGGSSGLVSVADVTEAAQMKRLLTALGVAPGRMLLEEKSRTTWENAVESRDLVHPAPGATWWLVTTGYHMPRAVATFRAAGWTGIVARPGSYATTGRIGLRPPMIWGLGSADLAVKEWLGLLAYRLSGRASELYPRP